MTRADGMVKWRHACACCIVDDVLHTKFEFLVCNHTPNALFLNNVSPVYTYLSQLNETGLEGALVLSTRKR